MENLDGALGFRATLDIDDFNVSAKAMERRIRDFSADAQASVYGLEDSFRRMSERAGQYISYYLVGAGMKELLMSIVETRGQFQQLEIAFGTMLGNEAKANELMRQMVDTAAKTPFDLMGVAEGAKQLMAYGVSADKVNDTLVRLGNIASGLSIPLNDIVYLYGTTMVQGRLYAQDVRQFTGRGIPLVKELAEKYHKTAEEINAMVSAGKIGFADVEEVINKMTNAGGQFYNLMEKQSSSLTGQIANLKDAWDTVLNDWGQAGEGLFAGAISGATLFVEHMDDVVRILMSIATVYGLAKAAIILHTLAMKNETGIAVVDNTVKSAKLALMKAEATMNGTVAKQTEAMTAAENAHVAALESSLSAEQRANILKNVRAQAIASLLTVQQQEYLSNLGLTASSEGYEAAAMGVLTAEQRMSLSKMDLTSKGAAYRTAIQQEIVAQDAETAATIRNLEAKKAEAMQAVESQKQKLASARETLNAAQLELSVAGQSMNMSQVASAQKKVEAAANAECAARKKLEALQTDVLTHSEALEVAQSKAATIASAKDKAAKDAQNASTNILSGSTKGLTAKIHLLWAAFKANPLGWVITIVTTLYSLWAMFSSKTDENTDALQEFNDTTGEVLRKLNLYRAILQSVDKDSKTYKDTLDKFNALCQEYNVTLKDENGKLKEQTELYEELKTAIEATTAAKIIAKKTEEKETEFGRKINEADDNFDSQIKSASYTNGRSGFVVPAQNIRNLDSSVTEFIKSQANEIGKKLSNLSDEEYSKEFESEVGRIMKATKEATNVTGKELSVMEHIVRDTLTEHAKLYRKQRDETEDSIASVKAFAEAMNNANGEAAEKIDISTLSLTELHDIASKLDGKDISINCKTYGFDTALDLLNSVNSQIENKQNDLDTDNGIRAEIKRLTDEQGDVKKSSDKYKEYDKQIDKLKKRLNPTRGGGNTSRNADTLHKKQLEADRKLEEARIAVMEEGYEKRKATLDLQHKDALQRIKDEEDELKNARKKAGKGGLTQEETAGFNERREIENTSYTKAQAKLFDGELDYKRKQYELYFRWVDGMGREVADTKFSELLKSGKSYKDYLEKEIASLEEKQKNGQGLTAGEQNHMMGLKVELDDVTGKKSALDAFKESVSDTLSRCQTLAEKIEAVTNAKEKLDNGETNLNEGDRLAAIVDVKQREVELQKELNNTVLNDYRTFEEQRKSITENFALLRSEAEKQGDAERVELIKKGEKEALSALNTSFLQQSGSWKKLFGDLDSLSVGQIDKLVNDIQAQVNDGSLQLNPVDYKALIESLDKARQEILNRNPFKALDVYFGNYIDAKKKLAEAKANLAAGTGTQDDVDKAKAEVQVAAKGITSAVESVTEVTTECASSLQSMFDALGMDGVAEGLGTAIELMGQLGNAAASVGKIMSGDIIGGVTGIISSISSVVGIFAKLHDAKYEKKIEQLQKQIDALERSYNRLERAFNNTYWVFNAEQRAGYEKNIELMEQQIAVLEKQRVASQKALDFNAYAKATAQLSQLKKKLASAKENGDMLTLYEERKKNLEEQQRKIREQMAAESDKKKSDDGKIQQWRDQLQSIDEQLEDMNQEMMETFAGTDTKTAIDQYADAIVDAYCQGEDAAKALGDTTRDVLKKAVVEALKREYLAKAMDEAVQFLGEAMSDGVLTPQEKAEFERKTKKAGETFKTALEAVGDWIKDVEDVAASDPLQGAVASLSEETGGVIAGRLEAFIINQAGQTSIMREQLLAQSEIARNTAATNDILERIEESLSRIEVGGNSLLSQGIS